MRMRSLPAAIALPACLWLTLAAAIANGPRFFRDDPISRDPETQDAARVRTVDLSDLYDFAENSFLGAGEKTDKRAVNVNTIDEVPDSSWFTNRVGRESWPADRLATGPDTGSGPSGAWTIVSGKMEGRAPRLHDPRRDRSDVLHQVRPADEPGDGERRRGHLDQVLPCLRLSRAGELHRGDQARGPGDRQGRAHRRPQRAPSPDGRTGSRDAPGEGRGAARRDLSHARKQGAVRQAGRTVPLLRDAARRPERYLSPRASAGASRPAGVRRLVEPRRLAQRQQPRHARLVQRPVDRPPQSPRLRIDARQRHRAGAEPAGRKRVPVGLAADLRHDAHARVLRQALDQGRLPGDAIGRTLRIELLQSSELETRVPEYRVRERPQRGSLLGRAHPRRDPGRGRAQP